MSLALAWGRAAQRGEGGDFLCSQGSVEGELQDEPQGLQATTGV